jgi:hypothetical protein
MSDLPGDERDTGWHDEDAVRVQCVRRERPWPWESRANLKASPSDRA